MLPLMSFNLWVMMDWQSRTKPQRHEGTKDAQRGSRQSPAWRSLRVVGWPRPALARGS